VEALCWCGRRATHNARVEDGVMVTEGEVILVGDTVEQPRRPGRVSYEVLCRQHYRRGLIVGRAGGAGGVGGAVGAGGAPAGAVPPPFDRPAADKHA